jgi:hypothetical protein
MHKQTAGGNTKDVFAVDLKVVDTLLGAELLDRLGQPLRKC